MIAVFEEERPTASLSQAGIQPESVTRNGSATPMRGKSLTCRKRLLKSGGL